MTAITIQHDGHSYEATLTQEDTHTRVEIYEDNIWAGIGTLRGDGTIECGAVLGGDQDTAERIYEELEREIADALADNGAHAIA